jgi:hypothetical protein
MTEIVSRHTRRLFQDSYVSFAVLRSIEEDFEDARVLRSSLPPGRLSSGARRTLVEEYYHLVDWESSEDVGRVLRAYESHLLRLLRGGSREEYEKLVEALHRDRIAVADGLIRYSAPEPHVEPIDADFGVDLGQLRLNIRRMRSAVAEDPALAIGSAKELVEATCKAILAELGEEVPEDDDLPTLVHRVASTLELLAKDVPAERRGAQSIRKVLGSLSQIVQGVAELRNLYGSGHGKSPAHRGLSPRHAKLCIGAASTLAIFLMETAVHRRDSLKK